VKSVAKIESEWACKNVVHAGIRWRAGAVGSKNSALLFVRTFGAIRREFSPLAESMSDLLLTSFKKVRGELVTSEPP